MKNIIKNLNKIALSLLLLNLLINSQELNNNRIEAKVLFKPSDIKYKISFLLKFTRAIFRHDNIFLLDMENHRILKLNRKGEIEGQIGGIGQADNNLYYPTSFVMKNEDIYVINKGGEEVKIFDIKGECKAKFSLIENNRADSIAVDSQGLIYINSRNKNHFKKKKLISVYNLKGKFIKSFGRIIEANNYAAYSTFNSTNLIIDDNNIYGNFNYYPNFFKYNLEGKEIYFKDMRDYKIKEIFELDKKASSMGIFGQINSGESKGIKALPYNYGIEIFDGDIIINNIAGKLFCFDNSGKFIKELNLIANDNTFKIFDFSINQKKEIVGIGFTFLKNKREFFFFQTGRLYKDMIKKPQV
ncbi:MAG: hypothetical protein ACFFDN_22680 [Candidatus Hodarchaeota archaeon]